MKRRLWIVVCCLLLLPFFACGQPEPEAAATPDAEATAPAPAPAPVELADADDWDSLLPNPRRPLEDVLSGGQPTAEQLADAAAAGFKTVINLRMPGERGSDDEATVVEGLGMTYVHLPINGAEGMSEENARALDEALAAAARPTMLHCGSGNRVGGLLALRAHYVDGLGVDEAMALGLEAGLTKLEPAVRKHFETAGD